LMRMGIGTLRTEKFRLHVVRSFINVASLSTWYVALALIPIADAAALGLSAPLFLTIGAALFLGERMKARRWAAIGIGVIGALIIIRPGFETLNIGFLFVIMSGVFSAGTKLFAKHLSKWDSAITCSAWVAILQTPLSFILALYFWTTPTWTQLGWLAVVGVLAALGHITMVRAITHVEVSSLEPFTYVRLLWAALIGYLVFSEFPGMWTWIGAAVIVGATSYIVRRESKLQGASGSAGLTPPSS
jgi:drug/metabolite transporter (DMT)-like permease